ncbi:LytR C-terminal domain-containing protein [Micrococcus luteus]|uniref:LytR C-terminal domain-containing protein n=1 Tax=Micrococcus luteus TaxID=1270 RepID=UPI000E00DFFF|nr:LytR C-terminal domain-containing protein [Micrococcus luteus]STY69794.1 Ribonucleases G and E [Micrococcus luteus]
MAYQPDRFDEVPEYTDQRGAHRESFAAAGATATGGGRRLSPLLWVAGLVLLAGLFVGVVLPWLTGDRSEPVAAESSTTAPAAEPSTSESSVSSSASSASASSASATESATPSEDAAEASRSAAAAESSRAAQEAAAAEAAESSRAAAEAQAAEASRSEAAAQSAEASRSAAAQAAEASAAASRSAAEASRSAAAAEASRSQAAAASSSRAAAQSAAASSSRAAAQSSAVRGTHVTVYNATRAQGLAASYAQRLRSAGYTSVDAKNWSGYGIQSSTVLYNGSAHKAAAEAVGKELGFPVMQTPNLQVNGVAVVVTG